MKSKLSISFFLPMFNESANIGNTIRELKSLAQELTDDYEIIVVDDASLDNSARIVQTMAQTDSTIRLFRLEKNTKFGGAFAKGFEKAEKDIIMYIDSDMPVSLEDIKASFSLIYEADIVSGYSKVKKGESIRRKIISGVYNFMVEALFSLKIKDINSGYKIVKREAVKGISFISKSPFVDVELFIHAKRKNCKVRQYPLIFKERAGGKSHIARFPVIFATFRDMILTRLRREPGNQKPVTRNQ